MAQTGTSLQGVPLLFVARGTAQEICDPLLFWMCVLPKHTRNTMSCCSTPLSIGRVAATSFQASGIISWHTNTQGDLIFDHASASTLLKSLLRFMARDTLSCRPGLNPPRTRPIYRNSSAVSTTTIVPYRMETAGL